VPERARLAAAVESASAGRAAVVVVNGPPGMGKTWLLDQAVRDATDASGGAGGTDRLLVLRAAGHPAELALPFAALHQLVLPVVGALADLPPPQRKALEGALAMADLSPRDRFAAGSGLHRLLTDLADRRPVLVAVDDAQWVDPSSRQALSFATRRLDADRVTIVVAGRRPGDHELGRPDADRVVLGPLDDDAARALVRRERAGIALPTLDAVVHAAAGLPLALHEVPAGLTPGQLRAEEPLPHPLPLGARLDDLYAGRLARLDEDAALALLVACLEPLDRPRLDRALAGLGLSAAALDPSQSAGLVDVGPGGARVAHPTLAAAVHQRATDTARRRAHEVLARVLADRPSRRASHLAALTDAPDDTVAAAHEAAGHDAAGRSAWLVAGQAHQAAADWTGPDDGRRVDRLGLAAMAFARAGASAPLLHALSELTTAATGPAERLAAETDVLAARVWSADGPIDAEAVRAVADRHGAAAPAAAARLLTFLSLGLVISGRPDEVAPCLAAAKQLAGPCPDDAELPLSWDIIDVHLGGTGGDVLGGDWAERLSDAELAAPSLPIISAASALIWSDAQDRAAALLRRQRDALMAVGALGQVGICHGLLAAVAVRQGDWADAQARYATAIALCTDTDLRGPLPHIQARSAYLRAALGDADGCAALFAEARAASGDSPVMANLEACARGLLALGAGRCREAVDLLAPAGAWQDAAGIRQPGYSSLAGDLAEALWRLRHLDALVRVATEAGERARRAGRSGPQAVAARCRALTVGHDEIDDAFAAALRWHRDAPDAFEEARTQLCWGRRLRLARRRRDARPHLRAAFESFERLGAAPWSAQARSELAACGERHGSGSAVATRLTPRELEVAVAVAQGASNPDAAAQLCISRRTVEDHLGRVYRKLGVRDRSGLVAALGSPGADQGGPGA
jgi:DNA-binding CsgD family transcriptional regulator